ncbi:MAG: purine-nucleoside phosphorylase [Ignavibacteria bacterium]|jgi:purine-nucleoside phosphorylase
MRNKIKHTSDHIKKIIDGKYDVGIILGTGLGGLVKYIKKEKVLDYSDIPNFPVSTVESHHGKLIFGKLSGKRIIAMQGRFHFYEGYTHESVTFPIHIMKELGIKYLIASNACGALNPEFRKTDLMLITSHINLHFTSPLVALKIPNNQTKTTHYYSKRLIELAEQTALENNINIKKGVYTSVQGPTFETKSELRMIRKIGRDVVGMSTIPEVMIAQKLGIETLGISIMTDEGFPDTLVVATLEDVLEAASVAELKMTLLIKKFIEKL